MATFQSQGVSESTNAATGDVAVATSPFTENLLRVILDLTHAQQLALWTVPS